MSLKNYDFAFLRAGLGTPSVRRLGLLATEAKLQAHMLHPGSFRMILCVSFCEDRLRDGCFEEGS